jgi:hypothetical protein
MYKLQVSSGLGDCLRILNDTKIVDRCLSEGVKCFVNYKTIDGEEWTYSNKKTFIEFIKQVPIFEYLEDAEFQNSEAKNARDNLNLISGKKVLPLPVPHSGAIMEYGKIQIAVQPEGSSRCKKFSNKQLIALFSAFDPDIFTFNIIDNPNKYELNKKTFGAFPNVVCREFAFTQNYHLLTECDLLVGPDSFAKYVSRAAGKKMIVVCTKLPYIADTQRMFNYAFKGIFQNPLARILGSRTDGELIDNVFELPEEELITAVKDLLR